MYKDFNAKGLIPAMITSFTSTGELDVQGVKANVEFLCQTGVWGLLVCGSTGEAALLTREERVTVIEAAAKTARGRAKVIAGTGAPSTAGVIRLCNDAASAGAEAALVVTPFYAIPTQEGLLHHYRAIHDATDLPLIVYNIPQHTGVEIELDTLEQLAALEQVVGLKESSCQDGYLAEAIRRVGNRIAILSGGDDIFFPALCMGAPGGILALGNLSPRELVAMHEAVQVSDYETARKLFYQILPIARAISVAVNFPSMVKVGVEMLGRPAGPPRSPILPLSAQQQESVRQSLVASELL
jgi:4-hydroxy-tetrahydrodipicolinate synthase